MAPLHLANRPAVVGMIHVGALPGTPRGTSSLKELLEKAVREATIYEQAGIDAVIIENMHDRPYLKGQVGPEIVACMTRVVSEVRRTLSCPCGVQVLAGANNAALAVALAAELQFIRVEGFVFAHVADEGWIDGCAGQLLRERSRIGADHITLWTDIKKKHSSHAITSDISLAETAEAAVYNLSDALIVSGSHTGAATSPEDVLAVIERVPSVPVYVGSGITADNVRDYAKADGFIVGSSLKEGGYWENSLCAERLLSVIHAARSLS